MASPPRDSGCPGAQDPTASALCLTQRRHARLGEISLPPDFRAPQMHPWALREREGACLQGRKDWKDLALVHVLSWRPCWRASPWTTLPGGHWYPGPCRDHSLFLHCPQVAVWAHRTLTAAFRFTSFPNSFKQGRHCVPPTLTLLSGLSGHSACPPKGITSPEGTAYPQGKNGNK